MSPEKIENVLVWGTDMEIETVLQAAKASRLPFVAGHVALMPDGHIGKGSTIGSVIPTQGAIIPACVGVDIGCGMIAVETNLTASSLPDSLDPLIPVFEQRIPAGVGKGHDRSSFSGLPNRAYSDALTDKLLAKAANQLGSLGGGNHFVEVELDERDHVWLVLHSGSRGVGKELAEVHIGRAKGL